MYIGASGISGYAPWATWLEIFLVIGGVTVAAVFVSWFAGYRRRKVA